MKLFIIVCIILAIIYYTPKSENFNFVTIGNRIFSRQTINDMKSNLSALSRPELQTPQLIDIDKIDFKNMSPEEYSKLITTLQQSNERPIIKNLPIFV